MTNSYFYTCAHGVRPGELYDDTTGETLGGTPAVSLVQACWDAEPHGVLAYLSDGVWHSTRPDEGKNLWPYGYEVRRVQIDWMVQGLPYLT